MPLEDGLAEEEPEVEEDDVPDEEADGAEDMEDEQDTQMGLVLALSAMLEDAMEADGPRPEGIPQSARDANRAEEPRGQDPPQQSLPGACTCPGRGRHLW